VIDLTELSARVAANLEQAMVVSAQAQEVMDELATLTGAAESPGRDVAVTVDHLGIITSILFSDDVSSVGADRLGPLVFQTTQAAIEDLRAKGAPVQARLAADARSLSRPNDVFESLTALRRLVLDSDTRTDEGAAK
jgi:YbaB/EbfC DNA-binding family